MDGVTFISVTETVLYTCDKSLRLKDVPLSVDIWKGRIIITEKDSENNDAVNSIDMRDVIIAKIEEDVFFDIYLYQYQAGTYFYPNSTRVRRILKFQIADKEASIVLSNVITRIAQSMPIHDETIFLPPLKRSLLLYTVNNKTKHLDRATWKLYEQMLCDANITYLLMELPSIEDCIKDISSRSDLLTYECIICIGNDSFLHDCINAIMIRDDWSLICRQVCIYTLPGSYHDKEDNSLINTITSASGYSMTPIHSMYICIKGNISTLDVGYYVTGVTHGFTIGYLKWCLPADIEIEYNNRTLLKSIQRYLIEMKNCIFAKRYSGKISYIEALESDMIASYWYTSTDIDKERIETNLKLNRISLSTSLTQEVPSTWKTIDSNAWLFIWICNTSYTSIDGKQIMIAPTACLNDGYFHITLIRNTEVTNLLRFFKFLRLGRNVCDLPFVETITTRSFRLEPYIHTNDNKGKGNYCFDGKVLPCDKFQLEVHRGLMKTYISKLH